MLFRQFQNQVARNTRQHLFAPGGCQNGAIPDNKHIAGRPFNHQTIADQ